MDWVRAGEFMQPLVNSGDFKIWPASSGPRGGIGNEHFICGSSGTLQSSVTGFLCMDIMGCPISPSQVHTEWTQTEHHNPAPRNTTPPSAATHPASLSKPALFSVLQGCPYWGNPGSCSYKGVCWYSHLWSGFFRAPASNLAPLPLKWAAFHPSLLLFALVSALRKYTFIFILLLKDIHLLAWWVFRPFFTVLIAHHHFKSTWNGWLELLRCKKMHFALFLLLVLSNIMYTKWSHRIKTNCYCCQKPTVRWDMGGQILQGSAKF